MSFICLPSFHYLSCIERFMTRLSRFFPKENLLFGIWLNSGMYVCPTTFQHPLLQVYVRKPTPQTDGEYLMNKWINMHNKQFFFNITVSIVNALNTTVNIYSYRLDMLQGKCHIKIQRIISQTMSYLSTIVCVRLHICISIYRSKDVAILRMKFQELGLSVEEKYIVDIFRVLQ